MSAGGADRSSHRRHRLDARDRQPVSVRDTVDDRVELLRELADAPRQLLVILLDVRGRRDRRHLVRRLLEPAWHFSSAATVPSPSSPLRPPGSPREADRIAPTCVSYSGSLSRSSAAAAAARDDHPASAAATDTTQVPGDAGATLGAVWLAAIEQLDSIRGSGACAPQRIRAFAQAAPAADRVDRPGRGRGARRRAREAQHQEGGEALGARARDPLLRPHDARGPGHTRKGRGALLEGDPARPDRPEHPVGRGGVRLPEPRPVAKERLAGTGVKVAASRPRCRQARARSTSRCARWRTRSPSARTRSTW